MGRWLWRRPHESFRANVVSSAHFVPQRRPTRCDLPAARTCRETQGQEHTRLHTHTIVTKTCTTGQLDRISDHGSSGEVATATSPPMRAPSCQSCPSRHMRAEVKQRTMLVWRPPPTEPARQKTLRQSEAPPNSASWRRPPPTTSIWGASARPIQPESAAVWVLCPPQPLQKPTPPRRRAAPSRSSPSAAAAPDAAAAANFGR